MDKKDLVFKIMDLDINIPFEIKYNNQYYLLEIIDDEGDYFVMDLETYDPENDYIESFFEDDYDRLEFIKLELIKDVLLEDIIEINIKNK